ncbi:MAG: alanyl-tRNA editing protein [Sarcina sp.]|nr:alanyl-tRNA editing protein [Sarcina sp.]
MGSLPPTEKLFDNNAYATEFEAVVHSALCTEQKGGKETWELILDRTLFFPEEGGQTPDTGEINGFPVTDVQLDGNVIRHYVSVPAGKPDGAGDSGRTGAHSAPGPSEPAKQPPQKYRQGCLDPTLPSQNAMNARSGASGLSDRDSRAAFAPGQTVQGHIDFAHRFSNMQNHSGEHILSGLVHGRFGYDNVGFHLSDNTVTLDFNGPLTDDDLTWLEQTANRVVWDNKEIRAWYPDPETLEKTPYRSKKEIDGPLRLVEIPGVDVCACCAPHVRRTGEIGLIKIIRTLRERGGIRLTILCGSRALDYIQTLQKAAEDVSHLTNMPREDIAAGVSRILEDNDRLRQREAQLEAQVTEILAGSIPPDQQNVFLFADGIGNLAQRRLVNDLCASHPGYCGVFVGSDADGYRYIIGAGEDAAAGTKDARVLNAFLHSACGARGGGKPAMVQGSVHADAAAIRISLTRALGAPEEEK